ncbi:MAG: hypothetical protein ABEI78_01135, partial [Candidatus Nanohaloarchaea archaeon]
LIGVAVFAVGAVFMFTQTRVGQLTKKTGTPDAVITFEAAAENVNTWCGDGESGIILTLSSGDSIYIDNIEIKIKTNNDPVPIKISPHYHKKWNPGTKLGLNRLNWGGTNVALPSQDHCEGYLGGGYISGDRIYINEGEKVSVTVIHKPSGSVIFKGEKVARREINSFVS